MTSAKLPDANYINGQWVKSGTELLSVRNKYDQSLLSEVPKASISQMETAIASSQKGFQEMKAWSAGKRSEKLYQLKELLHQEAEFFAQLISAEAGKPIQYARGEIARCQTTLEFAAAEALRFSGEAIPIDFAAGEGRTALTRRFPIGPIAAISPFNFPLNLALHKIAPALAVGCSIVLKPSPYAPLTALAFAGLIEQVGYPAGAVNVLMCDIPVAEKLVRDDRMHMLSFTGSPKVGWHLKEICGKKKVTLELGGNAAVVVDHTAKLEEAAHKIAVGAFLYAGQICISTQRIYVERAIFDRFIPLLVAEIEKIQSGNPADEAILNGPVIDKAHFERIASWVDAAQKEGAKVLTGGKAIEADRFVYAPTLLTATRNEMKVVSEEVFGPVAIVEAVADFDAAIAAVNDSQYGLQAGVFTNSVDHMKQAHNELEVGGLMINNIPGFRVDSMPYGGVKSSGFGREGLRYAMEEMTEPRLLVY
ncbi:MAG: aldehyde dehydrogenase family protein [Bacteroidota bacterium]